ncbi:bifunctional cystathionine gamma-lyase/homocysteine desulfhydrase [Sporolactobacillus shoreicorticis]|uniref:Bifunctional cystathionine gamma-lyase/homocysteine desulfhydrase n=1 Tax=Sporolactobacillus shoreicorticis TaxID=1923877 RepID=A0ABW5S534_9BACL|nr:bifunctional cystathionine gamma-lyase/homocysteine desulfhydrase [Sporolactobacillus shoreicorticis]MCO7126370.1 bifunctional cystathionine gamma-lyase/homocysteine desulfhydrase [Sporolactobacillus shoreicorticis]
MRPKTQVIHAGIFGDEFTGSVTVPIYQTSTYQQEEVGKTKGYDYSRSGNPTRHALEVLIQELEHGKAGFAFGSGMAAISSVLMLLNSGDHLVITDDVYGGTYRVIDKVFKRLGISATFVDTSIPENIEKAITDKTRALYLETPTNPLLKVTDIRKAAEIAHRHDLILIVDNTFATSYWQHPLDLGADIVLHSATKYIGGHSDVVAGLVAVASDELAERLYFIQNSVGAVPGPQDAWLLVRGIKTLGLRMEQIEKNANQIAKFLQSHPKVKKVYYPGLETHPGHALAAKQASGFGGMISFDAGDESAVNQILAKTRYFTLAESLGAVESLISVPAKMTHASIPKPRRDELGITDGLIRLSVGIEDAQDLIEDLEQALS